VTETDRASPGARTHCSEVHEGEQCECRECPNAAIRGDEELGAVSQVGYAAWRRKLDELFCSGTIPGCECGEWFTVCVPRPDGDGGRREAYRAP
jgi:hypothetical protein